MRRVLCVWLPTFSTDLARRGAASGASDDGDRRPPITLLTRAVASREVVARCCAVARRSGVAQGMDLAHARALLPSGAVLYAGPYRPERDAAALHALACWARRFSPLAAPDPPDGLLIDATGTERLHRGEARLIRAVAAGVARLGFAGRVAAGPTFGCAWAVSRYGGHDLSRVPAGREREAVEGLPVAALRVDESTVLGLGEIGITRVGQVLGLPRSSLAARFSAALILRLRQALGEVGEQVHPVRPAPPVRNELLFEGPTDHWESLESAARKVLEGLTSRLAARERGVRRLDVGLLRPRAAPTHIQIDLSRPSRAPAHLWSLLRSRLERVDLGEGVEGVVMTASRTERLGHEQSSSPALGAENEPRPGAWGEMVDTLAARLGAGHVVRMEPVESHLPERAFRERSAMESPPRGPGAAVCGADRPTMLFSRPEPADAMALTPDGPILSLGWRGRRWDVVGCRGPERIGQEWWRWAPAGHDARTQSGRAPRARVAAPAPPDRDYFAVETRDGRRLWVCRQVGTGRWFVHGEWS